MGKDNQTLMEPLLKNGSVYKLKCENCKSISIQITEANKPDCICLDCGGKCSALKLR
ncbi:hypothetical protein [Paraclostridium bifermentans]|uniref:hypothetical protein n=1 Tax=Paraclostridium bifermentans TaxID=1490 RepID=UPI00359C389D